MVAIRKSRRRNFKKKTLAKHITIESCCKLERNINLKTRIVADTINCYCICNGKHGKSVRYSAGTWPRKRYELEWKTDHMIGLAVQSM